MRVAAICVRCGRPKKDPLRQCKACGYEPQTEYEKARALIFSSPKSIAGAQIGRDAATLEALSAQTQGGKFYEFDPKEELRVVDVLRIYEGQQARKRARNRKILLFIALITFATIVLIAWLYLRTS